ncbi:MAG: substrate-binding domain-containing protein [Rhodobacteraceae bacterium]|nr:substrate-binding domain-containing protein [Paracoccaceae bacterium]
MRNIIHFGALALTMFAIGGGTASARDQIRIVGSSTVFPYTQSVAEQFSWITGAPSPIVESTGTGGGMKLFCAGIGEQHPDLTGASRAMKASEYALCQANGVNDISEALFGYDGLSIAISRQSEFAWDLSLSDIFLALAAKVPVDGEWTDNPYALWSDVRPGLPDVRILAYGPPPTSGTRDAFVELAMHAGCIRLDWVRESGFDQDKSWVNENCSRMRQDGPYIEAGENDNLIVQRLRADMNAVGIFGYSFLFENLDTLQPVMVHGIEPDPETIADQSYPISRPLYFYTKNAHRGVIPYLQEFIEEYVSEEALAEDGYLAERGLVALPDAPRAELRETVISAGTMPVR